MSHSIKVQKERSLEVIAIAFSSAPPISPFLARWVAIYKMDPHILTTAGTQILSVQVETTSSAAYGEQVNIIQIDEFDRGRPCKTGCGSVGQSPR